MVDELRALYVYSISGGEEGGEGERGGERELAVKQRCIIIPV